MPTRAEAKVTTDHDEIRQWAEERGARPTCVRNTGDEGDIGILRLDFPGYSGADSLEEISWEDFFEKFDERGLALLHQETTARGQRSNFNKLISRETAEQQGSGRSRERSARSRSASSSRQSLRSKAAKKKSPSRRARTTASSRARKAAGRKSSARSASTRSRSASAKRSAGTRTRSTGKARAASRGTRATSSRVKTGAKRTSAKSAARKSASAGRTQSSRGRTNNKGRSSARGTVSTRRSTSNASRSQSRGGRSSAGSRILTDHDEIRQWAEERSAHPACVRGTGRKKNDTGMIRLDFPGYSGARSLQEVDWEDWFRQFDDNKLALVVQDSTARGQRSNFNKIIGRETAQERAEHGGHFSRRHPERGRKTGSSEISGSRAQVKSTRGSNRGSRTASARGQHREQERRAA